MRSPYLFPLGSKLGEDNAILHARANRHRVDGYAGPLSIKTVVAGRVTWLVHGRELVVDPSSFLVLSAGEVYSMNIDSDTPVETCCAFFARGSVEKIALDLTTSLDAALAQPDRVGPELPYLSGLREEAEISRRVGSIASICSGLPGSGVEESFLVLSLSLLRLYDGIREQIARIPASRQATRHELYRRLLVGREYLHAHAMEPVSLASAAKAACISRFHFHRGFAKAFGHTPHRYLLQLKLNEARRMICTGSSVLDASVAIGFSSASAFTRAFRSHFGVLPSSLL